jgi:ribosome-binding factor A
LSITQISGKLAIYGWALIKRRLAAELSLRYMPDLKFFYDASFDYGAHIDRVLKSLRTNDEKNNPSPGEQ